MLTDYDNIWSAINPEFSIISIVNNDYGSAAYADSGGGILKNNILVLSI